MSNCTLLTLIIFLPTLGALALALLPMLVKGDAVIKWTTLVVTAVTCWLCFVLLGRFWSLDSGETFKPPALAARAAQTEPDAKGAYSPEALQGRDLVVRRPWIRTESFEIEYYLGVDGISLPLVVLTGVLSLLAMLASFSIDKHIRGYCILYLLLETGMMGVFLALDFFLFYVFWEVMLLPMYFLIGVWGGPRKEYAAIKFFLYTLLGSVLILIAMLGFYFNTTPHSFDIMKLHAVGQQVDSPFGRVFQITMFVLLFIGFAIKVPIVPFHTWLPDAHVEAPTPISMILAGVLLKMGGYGLLRIAYPICPVGAYELAYTVAVIGVVSIVYGAFAAMAQTDFKKLVAYSSVSHMGYVTLGIAVVGLAGQQGLSAADAAAYYAWGMNGAMFQMIAHGVSSAGMFFLVGVIYERAHHRDLERFGGLMNVMPLYGGISVVIFFAAMGLPGLCGFIGEVFTVLAGFKYDRTLGILAASGVVLTAGYILWTVQRVYMGGRVEEFHAPEMNGREILTAAPLVFFAVLLGVWPNSLLEWMAPDVGVLADQLTEFAGRWAQTGQRIAGM